MWNGWSPPGSFSVTVIGPPPDAPVLSPSNPTSTTDPTPTLSWSPVSGATAYVVAVTACADCPGAFVVTMITGTSFTTPRLPSFQTWHWKVKAVDASGNESDWSTSSFVYRPGATPMNLLLGR